MLFLHLDINRRAGVVKAAVVISASPSTDLAVEAAQLLANSSIYTCQLGLTHSTAEYASTLTSALLQVVPTVYFPRIDQALYSILRCLQTIGP